MTPISSGMPKQQIEADRGADHLGKIRGADRDLGQHPERP